MQPLQGRIALVTGASRGLGAAIATELARAGAAVAILGRDRAALEAVRQALLPPGQPLTSLPCDLADESATEDAVATTIAELGPIDVLVNNASLMPPVGRLPNVDARAWRRTLGVNLGAAFTTSVAVLPGMIARSQGWIVNISSGAAAGAGMPFGSAYSISKTALEVLTRHMAAELEPAGVRVNVVRPGRVDTDMQELLRDESIVGPELARKHQGWQATGELMSPTIPAWLVLAMCCTDSTGQVISVYDDEGRRLIAEAQGWLDGSSAGGPLRG